MKVVPIAPLAALAEEGLVLLCDNTFASPATRPLEHGVDLVIESASSLLGHNDVIGGAIALKAGRLPVDFLDRLRWNTMVVGGAHGAAGAWLLDRGSKPCPFGWSGSANAAALADSSGPAGGHRVCYPAARTTPARRGEGPDAELWPHAGLRRRLRAPGP